MSHGEWRSPTKYSGRRCAVTNSPGRRTPLLLRKFGKPSFKVPKTNTRCDMEVWAGPTCTVHRPPLASCRCRGPLIQPSCEWLTLDMAISLDGKLGSGLGEKPK